MIETGEVQRSSTKATFADKYTRFDNLPHGYTNTLGQ